MLTVNLNAIAGIAVLQPDGELSAEDFKAASIIIDPYIESAGKLNLETAVAHGFCGKSECERQGTARRQWL